MCVCVCVCVCVSVFYRKIERELRKRKRGQERKETCCVYNLMIIRWIPCSTRTIDRCQVTYRPWQYLSAVPLRVSLESWAVHAHTHTHCANVFNLISHCVYTSPKNVTPYTLPYTVFLNTTRPYCPSVGPINGLFPLSGAVRYSTVQYGTQLFPFPQSEVVNGTKIANCTVPLFWYPSVGVPSTAKGTKRVELNSLQKLIGWRG